MTTAEAEDIGRVWNVVKNWPVTVQESLARRILDSVGSAPPIRGKPVAALIGLGAGTNEPPTDDTVRAWIDEHRVERYGR